MTRTARDGDSKRMRKYWRAVRWIMREYECDASRARYVYKISKGWP